MSVSHLTSAGRWPTSDPYPWAPAVTSLEAVWDVAWGPSYVGSGSTWYSVVPNPASGANYTAYTLTTTNLTFWGTPNRKGRDFFRTNGSGDASVAANSTFVNSIHKAGAAVTFAGISSFVATGGSSGFLWATYDSAGGPGFEVSQNASGALSFRVGGGGGSTVASFITDMPIPQGPLVFWAVSVTAGGSSFIYMNGTLAQVGGAGTTTLNYSSPSSSNAYALAMNRAPNGDTTKYVKAGHRDYLRALWTRGLTRQELDFAYANLQSAGRI